MNEALLNQILAEIQNMKAQQVENRKLIDQIAYALTDPMSRVGISKEEWKKKVTVQCESEKTKS